MADRPSRARYAILALGVEDRQLPIGVLLLDEEADMLWLRLRDSWAGFPAQELDILESLAADLQQKAEELGPTALMGYLEDTLSNTLQISDSTSFFTTTPEADLERLFKLHIAEGILPSSMSEGL